MKPDLVLDIRALYRQETLAGSSSGQAFLPKLIDATKGASRGSVIAFDFAKVDLVTASFFRSAFRAFRDYARTTAMLYPVFVNANSAAQEEIKFFAEEAGDAFVLAKMNQNGEFKSPFVVGKLDDKQAKALAALAELGEADAGQLLESAPEDPPVKTSAAWSNRLAALASKGLVVERLEGRLKKYRPIIEDLAYGT